MRFRAGLSRDHVFLLPPRVDEWLPAGHWARGVDEAVELLDLSKIEASFHSTGAGAPAYPPKMLLKLVIYGYLTQRFSSRKISAACRDDLAMLWLARMEQPKHSAIADFRQRHVTEIPGWMAQVVLLCVDLGMVGFRLGAIDGSKFQADASKHKAMSYQRMQEAIPALEAEIAQLVAAHGEADQQKGSPPADHPDAETPPSTAQLNFTDAESHIMVTKAQGVRVGRTRP